MCRKSAWEGNSFEQGDNQLTELFAVGKMKAREEFQTCAHRFGSRGSGSCTGEPGSLSGLSGGSSTGAGGVCDGGCGGSGSVLRNSDIKNWMQSECLKSRHSHFALPDDPSCGPSIGTPTTPSAC